MSKSSSFTDYFEPLTKVRSKESREIGLKSAHIEVWSTVVGRRTGEDEADKGSFLCCSEKRFARAVHTRRCNIADWVILSLLNE